MVDRRMGIYDAMAASYHLVVDNGFWEHLALTVLLIALNAVADGPLAILAVPFTIATISAAYFIAEGRSSLVERM
jgi:hypothetical protein